MTERLPRPPRPSDVAGMSGQTGTSSSQQKTAHNAAVSARAGQGRPPKVFPFQPKPSLPAGT